MEIFNMRLIDFLRGLIGKTWDPNSIAGLGNWDPAFRDQGEAGPTIGTRVRGRVIVGLPLAIRLAEVEREVDELKRSLPDLKEL
jgi:hypothetical protein